MPRTANITRQTRETNISLELNLDGSGQVDIQTGIGFFDHLLTALAFHAGFDLKLRCVGDLEIDDHHTAEDCAICLGTAFAEALGDRAGIVRFGNATVPMDEALASSAIDLVRRPYAVINLKLQRECLGSLSCENIPHVLHSLAMAGQFTLHVNVAYGDNDHHKAEAAFKSLAIALRAAVAPSRGQTPSTKGVM